jgi:ISXO2-like transposase domain
MTDAWRGYITVGREFAGGHHRVDHGAGEYARGKAHVNTAESFFALLKRGIVGSFHHVSPAVLIPVGLPVDHGFGSNRNRHSTDQGKAAKLSSAYEWLT